MITVNHSVIQDGNSGLSFDCFNWFNGTVASIKLTPRFDWLKQSNGCIMCCINPKADEDAIFRKSKLEQELNK